MVMTLDQIVEEVRHLPDEQIAELMDRLSQRLHLITQALPCPGGTDENSPTFQRLSLPTILTGLI
jgi:hypothetical protein